MSSTFNVRVNVNACIRAIACVVDFFWGGMRIGRRTWLAEREPCTVYVLTPDVAVHATLMLHKTCVSIDIAQERQRRQALK